jgi:iron complex outermembrane receptor protein
MQFLRIIVASIAALSTLSSFAAIEEVVVTAQKRTESVQSVPISITAISGDELVRRGLNNMQDVARTVPNFDLPASNNMRNVSVRIRGIGSTGTNPGIENSVGTFLDGLYMPSGAMSFGELSDIQTIEILRGPQGTLYGRNTPIGALNITTLKPSHETEAMLRVGYGDYDQASISGHAGGSLSDSVASRLSFFYRDREGYEDNLFTGSDVNDNSEWGLRGKMLFEPSETVEVIGTVYYSEIERRCCMGEQIQPNHPTFGIATPGFIAAQQAAGYPFANFVDDDHIVDGDDEGDDRTDSFGASVQVEWDLGGGHLFTSITGYQDWENDVSIAADSLKNPVLTSRQILNNEVLSQEFRLTSPSDQTIEYIAGLYFYEQDTAFDSDGVIGVGANRVFPALPAACPPPCSAVAGDSVLSVFEQDTSSVAVYGNLTYNLSDVWDVTGGLRWSRDEKDAFIDHTNAPGNGFVVDRLIFPPASPGNQERSESKVTWSFNTRYQLSDDVMAFFTTSTGFKSGGFNSRRLPAGAAVEFDEEESTTFEAGIKSFWWDRRAMLNMTVFHTTIEGFQESTLSPTGTGFIVGNAGEQEVSGVEADFMLAPNENLTLNGSLAYLDAEYTDFSNAPCGAGEVPDNPEDKTCNRNGERPGLSPEFAYTLGVEWAQPFRDSDLEWFARADYSWRDEQHLIRVTLDEIASQDAYDLLDLRVGIGSQSGTWQVDAFLKNATDEAYFIQAAGQPVGGLVSGGGPAGARGFVGWYGPPRVWGLEVTLRPRG